MVCGVVLVTDGFHRPYKWPFRPHDDHKPTVIYLNISFHGRNWQYIFKCYTTTHTHSFYIDVDIQIWNEVRYSMTHETKLSIGYDCILVVTSASCLGADDSICSATSSWLRYVGIDLNDCITAKRIKEDQLQYYF